MTTLVYQIPDFLFKIIPLTTEAEYIRYRGGETAPFALDTSEVVLECTCETGDIFSKLALSNISGLAGVLQRIRVRLLTDGVSIEEEKAKVLQNYK